MVKVMVEVLEGLKRRVELGIEFRSMVKVAVHEKSLELNIGIGKAYGLPDDYQKKTIIFDKIHMLPSLPEKKPENYQVSLLYWIQEQGWIGFNLCSYQEDSWGPWEEDVWGPYFIPDKKPLSSTEIVEEIVKLYE